MKYSFPLVFGLLGLFCTVLLADPDQSLDALKKAAQATSNPTAQISEIRRQTKNLIKAGTLNELIASIIAPWFDRALHTTEKSRFHQLGSLEQFFQDLPPALQNQLSRKTREVLNVRSSLMAKNADLCEVTCELVRVSSQWFNAEGFDSNAKNRDKDSWHYAVRSLGALFLEKARPYCDALNAQIPAKLDVFQLLEKSRVDSKSDKGAADSDTTHLKSLVDALRSDPSIPKENLSRLSAFADKVMASKTGKAHDASAIYGHQFFALYLRELLRQGKFKAEGVNLEGLLGDVETSHRQEILSSIASKRDRDIPAEGDAFGIARGNSFFNTYAAVTSILSVPDAEEKLIASLREKYKALGSEPLDLPYLYSGNDEISKGTRHSAARGVPFYLAMYLKATTPSEKALHSKNLKAAIENFVLHQNSLIAHVKRNDAHLESDGLAPYYYYPAVPYVASAIKLLAVRAEKPAERDAFEKLHREVIAALLTLLQTEKLFTPMGENIDQIPLEFQNAQHGVVAARQADFEIPAGFINNYRNSPVYVNPLAGLALLTSLEQCGGLKVKPNFGIIDLDLETKIEPTGERSKSTDPAQSEISVAPSHR